MTDVNRDITLEINGTDFTFSLTPQVTTKYYNSLTQNNKVAPAYNLLMNTVHQEQRATLKELLANPTSTLELAGELLQEYAPDLGVIVKKPSISQTA